MNLWHLTLDTPRFPFHVSAGQNGNLQFGTWPIEDGQRAWIDYRVVRPERNGTSAGRSPKKSMKKRNVISRSPSRS